MKAFIKKYRHGFFLLYFLLYMIGFSYLEKNVTTKFHVVHSSLDSYIPFCEYFIIPYFLWFAFIGITVIYFLFWAKKKEYYQLILFLFSGMTIFLIVSAIYPNGHYLRPHAFARDNIFVHMVQYLYSIDTSTNVLPSIHVYNTMGAWFAIRRCASLQNKKWIQLGTSVLSILIILSTMYLKQHSIVDVSLGLAMALAFYVFIYAPESLAVRHPNRGKQFVPENIK